MSRNDRNEWTDSLDFESLADEQTGEGIADEVLQESGGQEAAASAQDPAQDASPTPADEADAPAPAARATPRPPRRARVSGAGLGALFAMSALVAAFGLAGAVVTALGIDPLSLWQPAGLLPFDGIIDFEANPLNLLYLVAVGTVLLALLGASSVARAVGKVGREAARDARLVDRLTALRIDEDKGWQDPLFKQHPTAAAFVNENIGAWRLGEARQRRSAGLEGELQRLLRAASANDRNGLNDRYDNPTVGSLADELLRHHDEREAAVQEAAAIRAKDREEAERLMDLITESCGWTNAAMDKVGVQGAAVERVAASLRRLADSDGARGQNDPVARAAAAIAALRGNLKTILQAPAGGGGGDLDELVDRSNKLAFQIAMEVARLGPRGERLLPMTQALEELTTEFRQVGEFAAGPVVPDDAYAAADHTLEQVQAALEAASANSETWRKTVRDAAPAATEAAAQLTGLATGFNGQAGRLNRAGEACALMTGLEFDPAAVAPVDPVEEPEPDLGFTRFDPFGARQAAETTAAEPAAGPLDIDPFATGTPDAQPVVPEVAADPFLAAEPDEVYDLGDFGGAPLEIEHGFGAGIAADEPAAAALAGAATDDAEADVLELATFGAVRLDEDMPGFASAEADAAQETIHNLSEFGAVSLD